MNNYIKNLLIVISKIKFSHLLSMRLVCNVTDERLDPAIFFNSTESSVYKHYFILTIVVAFVRSYFTSPVIKSVIITKNFYKRFKTKALKRLLRGIIIEVKEGIDSTFTNVSF